MKPSNAVLLAASVIAVPPLARREDLSIEPEANRVMLRYLEEGGISTVLYGGNATFNDLRPSEYGPVLEMLGSIAGPSTTLIPSIGPSFGVMLDQVEVLRALGYRMAMVLPTPAQGTTGATARALDLVHLQFGEQLIVYLKSAAFLDANAVADLHRHGVVAAVKYAVPRSNAEDDPLLAELCEAIGSENIVSGMGERPAVTHMKHFGLAGFTSGSVCIAPRLASKLLRALQKGQIKEAEETQKHFLGLENLRDAWGPVRVLHDAVTLGGIASMGQIMPPQVGLSEEEAQAVQVAALALRAAEGGAP